MKRNSRRASPATFGALIAARQVHPSAMSDDIATKLYSAFDGLKAGSTDDELFDRLSSTLNAVLMRAESIDELCLAPLRAAADAQRQRDAICGRHGRFGFDGPGPQAMGADCEEIIYSNSLNQMFDTCAESLKRINLQLSNEGMGA